MEKLNINFKDIEVPRITSFARLDKYVRMQNVFRLLLGVMFVHNDIILLSAVLGKCEWR